MYSLIPSKVGILLRPEMMLEDSQVAVTISIYKMPLI